MPAFDANLMFHTTANVTNSQSNGPLTVNSTPMHGLAGRVVVPTGYAAGDTIQAKYYGSTDGSNYYLLSQSRVLSGFTSTTPGEFYTPIVGNYKYIKEELVVTSTTAANINFGVVKSGLVQNVKAKWTRGTNEG